MATMTELFLDNEMIEMAPGLTRRLHQPVKHLLNPVVTSEHWWEGESGLQPYVTMYDEEDQLFKMWARHLIYPVTEQLDNHAAYMTYLTSTDGVNWNKPELGALDVGGRRDHNVVFTDFDTDVVSESEKNRFVETNDESAQGRKALLWSVVKHPHPKDEGEKFVGLAFLMKRRGAHLIFSKDGIHWTCENIPFWQTPHDVSGRGDDSIMQLIYDKLKQKWVIYRRIIPEFSEDMFGTDADRERPWADRYFRSYAYTESDDLQEWTKPKLILTTDPDDDSDTELYQLTCNNYGQVYIGYMSIFPLRQPQPIEIHLATSRDGINFTRVCRNKPFIPHGPLGYYDYMAMALHQPDPIIVDDTIYIYYAALNFPHDVKNDYAKNYVSTAALATFKRDRFASLETCDIAPCRLVTKPFILNQSKLYVNAETWKNGEIRAEILTRDWKPIEGFTKSEALAIQGDALDFPASWKANPDVSKLVGQEIRVKFYMSHARIYSMTASDEVRKLGIVTQKDQFEYRDKHFSGTGDV